MANTRPNRMRLNIKVVSTENLKQILAALRAEKNETRNDFKKFSELALHIVQIEMEIKERDGMVK